jgi:DNA-binding SARP family transcriptional activator
MDWRVLGPIEVWADGSPISLGGRQRRLVLAVLLANADQTVSTDRVIEEVWGSSPPDSARKTVQAHVAHLRKALNGDSEFLSSSGDGYRVSPDAGSLDADRFEAAFMAARQSADPERTVDLLDEALDMFRGEPYAGLADDALTVKVEASRLNELRLNAKEERLEALLAIGNAPGVAVEADSLLAEHPLREQLWAIHMLALYRSGRQSEALRSYSRARHILAEELGIEPSNALASSRAADPRTRRFAIGFETGDRDGGSNRGRSKESLQGATSLRCGRRERFLRASRAGKAAGGSSDGAAAGVFDRARRP